MGFDLPRFFGRFDPSAEAAAAVAAAAIEADDDTDGAFRFFDDVGVGDVEATAAPASPCEGVTAA